MANAPKNKTRTVQFMSDNRWLIALVLFLYVLYLLKPILTPFLAAAALAYICDPLVDRLSAPQCKYTLSRTLATTLVMLGIGLGIVGLFLILVPLLQKKSLLIAERLPLFIEHTRHTLEPFLQTRFGINLNINAEEVHGIIRDNWKTSSDIATEVLINAGGKGLAIIGVIGNLLILPVVLFYLLRDWDTLVSQVGDLVPREWFAKTCVIAKEVDAVVAEFLRGQLSVMLALSLFYSLGLWLAGLESALSIGLIAGLLSFVPYVGFALAFAMAVILALLQFTSYVEVVPVLAVFGLGQIVESMVLTPFLVGDRIGLHPVVVMLALLAGGHLFGLAGVLLALPASAAIAVGLRHSKQSYLNSDTYLN